jgi:hypothetical protein
MKELNSEVSCYHSVTYLLSSPPNVTLFVWVWNLVPHVKEEYRLRVRIFGNRALRRIFERKRDEATRG